MLSNNCWTLFKAVYTFVLFTKCQNNIFNLFFAVSLWIWFHFLMGRPGDCITNKGAFPQDKITSSPVFLYDL